MKSKQQQPPLGAESEDSSRNGTSRRRELLDIAAQVFSEKGVAHTTVRDIADRANLFSGSLYHHFQSKDQMVAEVLERGLRESRERDSNIVANADGPVDAMGQLIYNIVLWVAREPYVAHILSYDEQYIAATAELSGVVRERAANAQIWLNVIEDGIKAGVFDARIDPKICLRSLFAGVFTSVAALPPIGNKEPEVVAAQMANFHVSGLVGSNLELQFKPASA